MSEEQTKFILLADGRSGGNLVSRALDGHSEIHCEFGEPFVFADFGRRVGVTEWMRSADSPLDGAKPITGLRMQYAIRSDSFDFSARDFVFWAWLRRWRVVHLVRTRVLDAVVSAVLARASGEWTHRAYPAKPVTVDVQRVVRAVVDLRGVQDAWRRRLSRMDGVMEVIYEEVVADWEGSMGRMVEFLGASPMRLEPTIPRQSDRPLLEYVVNRAELVEAARRAGLGECEGVE